MTAIYRDGDSYTGYVKGAPEIIAELSSFYLSEGEIKAFDEEAGKMFLRTYEELASEGLRVLGLLRRNYDRIPDNAGEAEREPSFLGLVGCYGLPGKSGERKDNGFYRDNYA